LSFALHALPRRKVTKNKRFFPSDEAAFKQRYLALQYRQEADYAY